MAPKHQDSAAAEPTKLAAGDILVRVNPLFWRTNFVEVGDITIGHDEPYTAVPQKLYDDKIAALTRAFVDNDGQEREEPLVVVV